MNSLKLMMDEMNKNSKNGVTVELKQQQKDGSLIPVPSSHLDALGWVCCYEYDKLIVIVTIAV